MGRHHARILSSLDGVDFVGVADPSLPPERAPRDVPVFETLEQLLEQDIDYCVVASPTASHENIALELAAGDVCVLIEKPLSVDLESSKRILRAFDKADLLAGVGHVERYNPALQQARHRIEAGEIGDLIQIHTRRQGPFPGRIADVGVVKDLATHDIDLTSWITQRPYVDVMAQMAYQTGRAHEDLLAAVAGLRGGVVACHLVNWLTPFKERQTVVTGTAGSLVVDTLSADLTFFANGLVKSEWDDVAKFRGVTEGDMIRYAFPKFEPLRLEHEAFRNAVLGFDDETVSLAEGLATVGVAEALVRSASSGQAMRVEHFLS